jgi:type II secretory pathway pseudopilin PulG
MKIIAILIGIYALYAVVQIMYFKRKEKKFKEAHNTLNTYKLSQMPRKA